MGTEAIAPGKKKRTGLRPGLRVGLPAPEQQGSYREVFRFRRSWPAIIILLVLDIVFLIPAVTTAGTSIEMWQQPEDLFDLVGALFTTFWLMGWSLVPLLMTAILLVLLFGREVVSASRDGVEVFLGLPFIGLAARYQVSHMRNLRLEHPAPKSGTSWRGSHLVFDYGANTGEIGSSLNELDLSAIRGRIEAATDSLNSARFSLSAAGPAYSWGYFSSGTSAVLWPGISCLSIPCWSRGLGRAVRPVGICTRWRRCSPVCGRHWWSCS